MRLNGEPIQSIPLPSKSPIDIRIESLEGCVSEYEQRDAARFSGYTWPGWLEEDAYGRAAAVAYYRLHYAIEAHANAIAERQAEVKAGRSRRRESRRGR